MKRGPAHEGAIASESSEGVGAGGGAGGVAAIGRGALYPVLLATDEGEGRGAVTTDATAADDDDATAAAAVSGGQGAQPSAGAEVVEECFEIAALELWAVDAPRARALTSCARHELLSAD